MKYFGKQNCDFSNYGIFKKKYVSCQHLNLTFLTPECSSFEYTYKKWWRSREIVVLAWKRKPKKQYLC